MRTCLAVDFRVRYGRYNGMPTIREILFNDDTALRRGDVSAQQPQS